MEMLARHQELLNCIIEELGTDVVATSDVWRLEQENPKYRGATALIRKYGVAKSRGVYALNVNDKSEEIQTENVLEVPEVTKVKAVAKTSIAAAMDYVPKKNKNYVKFGFYDDMKTIIKSEKFAPTYIVGDSGNGKTMTVLQVCAELGRECLPVNVTNETSEEDLIGHQTLKDGNLTWEDGPALVAMKRGAILLLDELDQGTSRLLCLQTILQSHSYYNKKTGEMVHAAPGFTVVATGNTRGDGVGQDLYIGAQLMNEAFLDRFPISFEHQYPNESVERRILGKIMDNEQVIEKLVSWAHSTRRTKATGAVEHSITTRRLTQVAENFNIFGEVKKSISLACARFDEKHRLAFSELWDKMQDSEEPTPAVAEEPAFTATPIA